MYHTLISGLRVQSWKRKAIKQHVLGSVWDQLSNRTTFNATVPQAKEKRMPTQIFHKVTAEFDEGTQTTTIPWVSELNMRPLGGPNKAEGKEKKLTTLMRRVPYNIQRVPIIINDESVDGDLTKFYRLAEQAVDRVKDVFVKTTDWNCQRATWEGADYYLTDEVNWTGAEPPSQLSAPESLVMHPNAYVDGAAGKQTWSATYATAETTLQNALAALATTNIFGLNALDRCHLIASRTVCPLPESLPGIKNVKWVLKLSDASWYQLSTESSTGWRDMLKHTAEGFDRMIDGAQGVYKNMLILVDQRSPLYKLDASAGSRFIYALPEGDARTRVQKTNSNADGTIECNALYGAGALGKAEISELDFKRKGFDYDFSTGSCGMRKEGTVRMDVDTGTSATSSRRFESGFTYYTVTSTATI